MAEFKEVMKILKRQYESMGLYDFDYAKMEEDALKWAAEHPEPVYPTFAEWLYESFLKWCQANHPGRAKDEKAWFDYLYETRIPEEMAEKLGIEPKEGK